MSSSPSSTSSWSLDASKNFSKPITLWSRSSNNNNNTIMSASQQFLPPFQIRFEKAFKEPPAIRCQVLTGLIQESLTTNTKEIQQRFVILVEDIFSFSSNVYMRTDWRLKSTIKDSNINDFNAVFDFLHINGPLFHLIRNLMNDINNRYEFPIVRLPTQLRISLEEGLVPNFFVNKLSSGTSGSIVLNPFEFYMLHFAYYIINPELGQNIAMLSDLSDSSNPLYYMLLDNYMQTFIPTTQLSTGNNQKSTTNNLVFNESSSLWKSLSSTTSNIFHLASSPRTDTYSLNSTNANTGQPPELIQKTSGTTFYGSPYLTKSTMLNSKILSVNKLTPNLTAVTSPCSEHDPLGSALYKCECLLNIFTELWLNLGRHSHCLEDTPAKTANLLGTGSHSQPQLTIEHMRVVRVWIKHLHYFTNSYRKRNNADIGNTSLQQYNSGGMVPSSYVEPLDDLRRNLWSSKYPLQKRLYQFLRLAFDRWPNDSSFRVPLETWLSYVQPWRYVAGRKGNQEQDTSGAMDIIEWRRFISENLFFYTVIFRQVITRISKILDLNLNSNAFLLHRITKIFAQSRLPELVKECEMQLLNGPELSLGVRFSSNNSLLSPSLKQMNNSNIGASIKHTLMEMEPSPAEYVSLFSHSFRDQIIDLLLSIARHLQSYKTLDEKLSSARPGVALPTNPFSWLLDWFTQEPANSSRPKNKAEEANKTKYYLESSVRNLSVIFSIQEQSVVTILSNDMSGTSSQVPDNVDFARKEELAYELVDGVPKLSDVGRNMMLNGSMSRQMLPHLVEGNPDTQPVRTFEISLFVHLSLLLSSFINKRYGSFFESHFHEKTFLGAMLQQLLSPPVKYVSYSKSNNRLTTNMSVEQLPPRVNLRFLASKLFIFYITFVCIFSWLLNCSSLYTITFLCLTYITYICAKSMFSSLKFT